MNKFKDINASITIRNGELVVEVLTNANGLVKNELDKLLIVKDVLCDDTLFYYESRYQRKFIPNETTVYNLPKEE